MKIVVIQGPNINMLGTRETSVYGSMKMEDIHAQMKVVAEQNGVDIEFFQTNFEGEIVDKIQECFGDSDGIIINPAAYTHTSIAIRDAIAAVNLPVIEVHISNIARREEFRQKSLISAVTAGQIIGFGPVGYHLAMIAMLQIFEQIKAVRAAREKAAPAANE
ncbi:type II 3-dehydroquinate dehydratase [Campylobacter geochelonis]|uniref:3-dehydroquinate dehydratase n=1 Tax=Campylobacter geochelonis TaxID=1780362 RepID=A0A128EIE3_9BACT|nr:type II 3-dehydroquinate dehydratase [Campylobacter geochelonis]QKF70734.1 3-dehydroquinate dehydratase [Campylobacter geochelonis]CZE47265.1 3-dehydroquinate dehydratase [Campylobacter geochelonis]CZE48576.1 3-dehydroquinate dehydratase [Campylobacter geochelonis]CZE50504.1 3-dehydroquinate dehydratase [Campylobacter geochelonis]